MKNYFSFNGLLVLGLVSLFLFTTCQTDELNDSSIVEESDVALRNNNSILFPTTARPLGKSTEDWAIEMGRAFAFLDCESIDLPQLLRLNEKVVAPFGSSLDSENVEWTITKDQYILLSPAFIFNDYPCPAEFELEPAEGQSLEDFLKEFAKEIMDTVETIEVIIDGTEINGAINYRVSTDLFYFTGNPELAECADPCITGDPQPAIIDGYFMMLKKLDVGTHTITVKLAIPSEEFSYEWNLLINVTK